MRANKDEKYQSFRRVDGEGPIPSAWMVVGEGPGPKEAATGRPFVGPTGDEMRRFFDGNDLPDFDDDVFRTNVLREYRGRDYEYTAEDVAADEPILLDELVASRPEVIVAVGRYATRWLLGDVTMDQVHGLPWSLPEESVAFRALNAGRRKSQPVVFPCFHPAAGFRSPEASALVSYDFGQLAAYAAGELKPRKLFDDPIPTPCYVHLVSPTSLGNYASQVDVAEDSEGFLHKPYSVQFSHRPGFGFLIKADDPKTLDAYLTWLLDRNVRATFHSALHDRGIRRVLARLCGWSEKRIVLELDRLPFDDTMVMAYLLQQEPQGLKALATRHANMAMQSYDEVIGDVQYELAQQWLSNTWECLQFEYEEECRTEFARINASPILDAKGKPKTLKDGSLKMHRLKVVPKLPKSSLHKAVERCLKTKEPYRLWTDQSEEIELAGYAYAGEMPMGDLSDVEFPKALYYGGRDPDATLRVRPELAARMDALGLRDVYNLELSTYPMIDRMMAVGMKPDLKVFSDLSQHLAWEIADVQVRLEEATGVVNFNANSGDQVAHYLFDVMGLPPLKMTKGRDRASTNDKILETLEKEHGIDVPAISDIRECRELRKLKGTFVDRVPDFTNRWPFDGRVHATFRTTRVITGRLSASDPNVLAMPKHGKFARDFQRGWVAATGHSIGSWDMSQIELRVLAHLSEDPVLTEAYLYECKHRKDWQSGKTICKRDGCVLKGDLHARLAHQVFGVQPSNQDDSKHRLPAKTHNFGLAMGMTCYGLMIELRKNGVEVDEDGAQEWIDASNKLYARVPKWKAEAIAEAKRHGYIRCLSGRIRYIGGIRSRDERLRSEAERFAFSTKIQEGAQRSMKEAEAYIWTEVISKYHDQGLFKGGKSKRWVEPLVQIHDDLKLEIPEGLEHELHTQMVYAMTKVPTQLRVPLGVEGKFGPNMADMRKF